MREGSRMILASMFVLSLSACGGGGDGTSMSDARSDALAAGGDSLVAAAHRRNAWEVSGRRAGTGSSLPRLQGTVAPA